MAKQTGTVSAIGKINGHKKKIFSEVNSVPSLQPWIAVIRPALYGARFRVNGSQRIERTEQTTEAMPQELKQ